MPESFTVTLVPVEENETDMSYSHPEGEGTEETVRSNDWRLIITVGKGRYIVLFIDILEKSITSTQADLR